jgi:hypothetical protein
MSVSSQVLLGFVSKLRTERKATPDIEEDHLLTIMQVWYYEVFVHLMLRVCNIGYYNMLLLQLPTNPTSASTALCLRVIEYMKAAPDELSHKIDHKTVQEGHGDGINKDIGWFKGRMGEMARGK